MTKVFIGGSRRISRLNKDIRIKLDQILEKGYTILLGDANGADKSVQKYLHSKNYNSVIIYCMENKCRNNIGNWLIESVKTTNNKKDFHYYSVKDLEMVKATDYAFMIWDAKSKGTFNNIVNLLIEGKTILLYFSPTKRFYTLFNLDNMAEVMSLYDEDFFEKFKGEFKISQLIDKVRNQEKYMSSNQYSKSAQLTMDDLLFNSPQ